jgi:hypothetical protein
MWVSFLFGLASHGGVRYSSRSERENSCIFVRGMVSALLLKEESGGSTSGKIENN